MKKFKIVMLAAVCVSAAAFLSSCEDDQFSVPMDGSGTSGTYKMTAFNIPESVDFDANGSSSSNLVGEVPCLNDDYLRLNRDHTYIKIDNYIDYSSGSAVCTEFTETGEWKMDGDVVTTTSSETNGYASYDTQYTLSGGVLTNSYDAYDYPIDEFTGSNGAVSFGFTKQE